MGAPRGGEGCAHRGRVLGIRAQGGSTGKARGNHVQDASQSTGGALPTGSTEIKTNAGKKKKTHTLYVNINTAYTPPCMGT